MEALAGRARAGVGQEAGAAGRGGPGACLASRSSAGEQANWGRQHPALIARRPAARRPLGPRWPGARANGRPRGPRPAPGPPPQLEPTRGTRAGGPPEPPGATVGEGRDARGVCGDQALGGGVGAGRRRMRAKSLDSFSENSGGPCRVSGVRQCLALAGTPGPRPGLGGGGGLRQRARPRGPRKQVTRRPAGGPRGGLQGRGGACQSARPPPARAGGAVRAASRAAAGSRAPPGAARELGAPAAAARCGAPGKPPSRAENPGQTRGPRETWQESYLHGRALRRASERLALGAHPEQPDNGPRVLGAMDLRRRGLSPGGLPR